MSENEESPGASPNVIRAACRARLYDGLETLSSIARDPEEKSADRIRALDALGRFGLGAADQAQVHIHAQEGAMVLGIVHLPALEAVEEVRPPRPPRGAGIDGGLVENGPGEGPRLLTSGEG
jgi:hypothetical protein